MICLGEVKLICICGMRTRQLTQQKAFGARRQDEPAAGASTSIVDLSKHRLPLLAGEASEPRLSLVECLRKIAGSADGLIIASAECNGSITPILKNTTAWISSYEHRCQHRKMFNGKFTALLSCTPGALGGPSGLQHMQEILQHLDTNIIPKTGAVHWERRRLVNERYERHKQAIRNRTRHPKANIILQH